MSIILERLVAFCRVGDNPHEFVSGAPRMGFSDCTEIGAGVFELFLAQNVVSFSDAGPVWKVDIMLGAPGAYGVLRQSASSFRVTVVDVDGAPLRTGMAVVMHEYSGPSVT